MKWLVLACVLCGGYALGVALRARKSAVAALVFALGLLVLFNDISFTPGSLEQYRGTDRGFDVSLLDVAAYVLYFAAPPASRPAPFRAVRYAYFAVGLASLALAPAPLYGVFTLWSLLKVYLMISALYRAFEDVELVGVLYKGLSVGLIYLLIVCLYQRYVQGVNQVAGTFAHQNTMGMAAYMAAAAIFPLVIRGDGGRLSAGAIASATLVVILSLSRGCLVALPAILATLSVASIVRKPTRQKAWVIVLGFAAALVLGAKSFDTIFARFTGAPERSAESRVIYEAMAHAMFRDHPLGVGLNQFSLMAGDDGYMSVAAAMDASWVSPNALVHNIYLMTLAELGIAGLVLYVALIGQPILAALRGAWRHKNDLRGELLFGCFAGLVAFSIHGQLEWVARQARALYLFWMLCVVVAALSRLPSEGGRASAPRRAPAY